ncbi:unnamed protein product, partial [Notodromas monacha]
MPACRFKPLLAEWRLVLSLDPDQAEDNKDGEMEYMLLTDILGIEDYMGDMDFKIAGTRRGVTALQADVKLKHGISLKIVMEAIQRGFEGKAVVLGIMNQTIVRPRSEKKGNWPVSEEIAVPIHKRSRFLGPGGLHLKSLTAETGVQVFPVDESKYCLFAPSQVAMDEGKEMIEKWLVEEREPQLEFGSICNAKITEVRESGVMLSLHPAMTPVWLLLRVVHPSALGLEVGHEIAVKYFGRDPVSGQ